MRSSPARATAEAEPVGRSGPDEAPGLQATVLNIQRMSTEDGPGIRTTVFFKGCAMRCAWCHNPESIAPRPRLVWSAHKCIGCGGCAGVCAHGALQRRSDAIWPEPRRCRRCGACAEACPAAALERLGRRWSLPALVAEVARDRAFFGEDGGVTASGGDPLQQAAFCTAFLQACQRAGLHTALDTCGAGSTAELLAAARHADVVLYDLKEIDPARHAQATGRPLQPVLDNARALAAALGDGQRLWIRTPLIPGATARHDNLAGLGRFIAGALGDRVERWELLAFNNLCREQYARLGQRWEYGDSPLLGGAELERLAAAARGSGVAADRVVATGPTRQE